MSVSAEQFRDVLGCLAGGVCVIATRDLDGRPHGLTATAVSSVSLDPPLVLACVSSRSSTHDAIAASRIFAVSFLGALDTAIADRFAGGAKHKFEDIENFEATTGAPILDGSLAWCDCTVVMEVPAGDHTVFIGRVEAAEVAEGTKEDGRPLLHYRGAYRTVADES